MNALEQFTDWVDYLPEFIKEFQAMLDADLSDLMDYSPESLDLVEEWILTRYANTDEMLPTAERRTVNLLACYVGETMRRSRGGEWQLQSDPDQVFYGLPVILMSDGDFDCPLTLVTASADRRTGNVLRTVIAQI